MSLEHPNQPLAHEACRAENGHEDSAPARGGTRAVGWLSGQLSTGHPTRVPMLVPSPLRPVTRKRNLRRSAKSMALG